MTRCFQLSEDHLSLFSGLPAEHEARQTVVDRKSPFKHMANQLRRSTTRMTLNEPRDQGLGDELEFVKL